jgi:hypothetical protein
MLQINIFQHNILTRYKIHTGIIGLIATVGFCCRHDTLQNLEYKNNSAIKTFELHDQNR